MKYHPHCPKHKQLWALAEGGDRLTLTTEMPGRGPMPAMSFERVFDRVTEAAVDTD